MSGAIARDAAEELQALMDRITVHAVRLVLKEEREAATYGKGALSIRFLTSKIVDAVAPYNQELRSLYYNNRENVRGKVRRILKKEQQRLRESNEGQIRSVLRSGTQHFYWVTAEEVKEAQLEAERRHQAEEAAAEAAQELTDLGFRANDDLDGSVSMDGQDAKRLVELLAKLKGGQA